MSEETASTAVAEPESTPEPTTETPAPRSNGFSESRPSTETSRRMNRSLRSGLGFSSKAASREDASDVSTESDKGDAPKTETESDEPKVYSRDDLGRFVQAEVDRREAKRNRDAQANAKRQQEAWLRDNDAQAFADLKRQEDAAQSVEAQTMAGRLKVAEHLTTTYDRAVLDPLFLSLPKEDQNALLKENAHLQGMESRTAMTKGALKLLEKHYRAEGARDAEAKLRNNPAFQKRILNQMRGTRDEPETIAGAPKGADRADMNAFLRAGR